MSKHNYAYSCKTLESSNPYNIENALAFPYGPARGRPGRGSSPHRRHGAPRSLLNASWWARRAVSRALCSWMHGGATMANSPTCSCKLLSTCKPLLNLLMEATSGRASFRSPPILRKVMLEVLKMAHFVWGFWSL